MKIKGSVVTEIRELIREKGLENQALSKFCPEIKEIYINTLEISWVSVTEAGAFFQAAAEVVFPGDPMGIRKLGIENANRHFKHGIYQMLLKITNTEMVIKRAASVWKRFHQKGVCEASRPNARTMIMIVRDYPELPEAVRKGVAGEALGVAQMTTSKIVSLQENYSNPEEWKWIYTW